MRFTETTLIKKQNTLSLNRVHRLPQLHSAPLEQDLGSGEQSCILSHPAGSERGSRLIQSATGTSVGNDSPPGSAVGRSGQRCAGEHIPGTSLD